MQSQGHKRTSGHTCANAMPSSLELPPMHSSPFHHFYVPPSCPISCVGNRSYRADHASMSIPWNKRSDHGKSRPESLGRLGLMALGWEFQMPGRLQKDKLSSRGGFDRKSPVMQAAALLVPSLLALSVSLSSLPPCAEQQGPTTVIYNWEPGHRKLLSLRPSAW